MLENCNIKINSCGIHDCSPEWHWETSDNGFDDYDLWAVFRGRGIIEIGSESFDVEEGTCFIIPPNKAVKGTHFPEKPLLVINVHFSVVPNNDAICLESVRRYMSDTPFFKTLLNRVISFYYREQYEEAVLYLRAALNEFFFASPRTVISVATGEQVRCIEEICKKINESPDTCSLSGFSLEYGYSATYLGKIFHKLTGVSFSQYVLNAKINQAKFLLRTTDITVFEISDKLGYYDSSHFIKQFKRETGISPVEYRRYK